MKKLKFKYKMDLKFSSPVTGHYFALRCVPGDSPCQEIRLSKCEISPADSLTHLTDGFGNRKISGACMGPHSTFGYDVEGTALVEGMKVQKGPLHPVYRFPSPYTIPGEKVMAFAENAARVCSLEGARTELEQALTVMRLVYEYMVYDPKATDTRTTAEEALALGRGVCQDYAHIMTAVLRRMEIPARYVTGLMIGEGASHAWTEVYTDGGWYGLDPTNCLHTDDYYIRIAVGRDFGDCPADKGCFRGQARQEQRVYVNVEDITDDRNSSINGTSCR